MNTARNATIRHDWAEFVASSYDPIDTFALGTRVIGRAEAESWVREREGVVVGYEFGSAIVEYPSGNQQNVRDAMLIPVPHEAPEVGDAVEVTDYDPQHVGEWGTVEVASHCGSRVQVRTPSGELLAVWPSCLRVAS